jgi:hypothetical protein
MNTLLRVIRETAWGPIVIGFLFVLIGWLVPFLTTLRMIPSTFLLLFGSYALSVVGLMLGIIGSARIIVKSRNSAQKEAQRRNYPWEQNRTRNK